MWNRGIRTALEAASFVEPSYERDVYSPSLFLQMPEAVAHVFRALEEDRHIVIHGDYDADGVCGASLLYEAIMVVVRLLSSHAHVKVFLPERERDGYGVNEKNVRQFLAEGATLLITVDCGIANREPIALFREGGGEVIVCDHHALARDVPDAVLLHPLVPGETYPNKKLCGTGVASKLAFALYDEARRRGLPVREGSEKWLLDLVAIATVTDVMPLVGENRALEYFGLRVLEKTRRTGLRHLLKLSGSLHERLTTTHIGFRVGPRLNAAGRMKHAELSHRVLVEEDDMLSAALAVELDACNKTRQKESDALYAVALEQARKQDDESLIFVWGEGWHLGLVGLVAGKLQTELGRPVMVAGKHGERFVGSGRSVRGYDLVAAMHAAEPHFVKYGGHPQACGFTVEGEDHFHTVRSTLHEHARKTFNGVILEPEIFIDTSLALADLSPGLVEDFLKLEPHGEGNPRPLFLLSRVKIAGLFPVGQGGKHARLILSDDAGHRQTCIAFGFGYLLEEMALGSTIDAVCEVGWNEWNGRKDVQCSLIDWRHA
ncbi:single-stranded-DNA-specific exonuclease RecJ [Candidatus Uhrbacteria bacterium]|nr:single-stranded-DNA-specific exonuclease RecJ [Candidatus Uhrbacteria bacterium]